MHGFTTGTGGARPHPVTRQPLVEPEAPPERQEPAPAESPAPPTHVLAACRLPARLTPRFRAAFADFSAESSQGGLKAASLAEA